MAFGGAKHVSCRKVTRTQAPAQKVSLSSLSDSGRSEQNQPPHAVTGFGRNCTLGRRTLEPGPTILFDSRIHWYVLAHKWLISTYREIDGYAVMVVTEVCSPKMGMSGEPPSAVRLRPGEH
jgi:hypothetical protein